MAGILSRRELSQLLLPWRRTLDRCLWRVKAPEPLFSRSGPGFPTVEPKPISFGNHTALIEPDLLCQQVPPIGIVAHSRQVRMAPVFVCEQPQAFRVDAARSPQLDDRPAALFMPAVLCVLALRTVG